MSIPISSKDFEIIHSALGSAKHLIADEYQSLCDDELKGEYDLALGELEDAIKLVEIYKRKGQDNS